MNASSAEPVPAAGMSHEPERAPASPFVSTFSDAIPEAPVWHERITRTVAAIGLAYGFYWIWWRWTASINWEVAILAVPLVLAETWGLFQSCVMVFTVWKLSRRTPPPAPRGLAVDVYVTAFDEPLEVLRRTMLGARSIRYPHRTYLLDDGKRDELLAMARELGCGYIRRVGNDHAKAGNLNHAMGITPGDFVLQLDADHVALPHILDRMLGFFEDPKVAFVQSPQDFYNTDSFSHVVNDEGRRFWEENRIFFTLIQSGKDVWNAAFFCGSCGILRKSALAEIGGFSLKSIIEDMETSILLHAAGFKSVYLGETLAYGLAPATAVSYHVQRLRWGTGAMQILRKMNPLFVKGLTMPQRFLYFVSVAHYFDGYQKAIFYLAPMMFFFTGAFAVRVGDAELFVRLGPYVLLTVLAFELLSRGTGWILLSERYQAAKFFTYMLTITGLFARKPLKFHVTPKGQSNAVPFSTYAPQLTVAVLSFGSLVWATLANTYGWVDYDVPGWGAAAFWINGVWIMWNVYFSLSYVHHALAQRQQRADHRFIDVFPIRVQLLPDETADDPGRIAMTRDLNPSGLSFRSYFRVEPGTKLRTRLPLASAEIPISGVVVHVSEVETDEGRVFQHGVRFEDLPMKIRDTIELHLTQQAVPLWRMQHRQSVSLLKRATEVFANTRSRRRRQVQLPAAVSVLGDGGDTAFGVAILDELSEGGARLLLERPLEPGTRLRYAVPGTQISGEGTVIFNRVLESPLAARFAIGLALSGGGKRVRGTLWRRLGPRAEKQVAS